MNKINFTYIKIAVLSFLTGLIHCSGLLAQSVIDYDVRVGQGNFQSIGSSSNATSPEPTETNINFDPLDEGAFNNIPIGFPFVYLEVQYSTLSASTNGWLALLPNINDSRFANSLEGASLNIPAPVFAPLWDDLSLEGGKFSYQTVGDPGNRIFTAEWLNVRWNFDAEATISFQVNLYEEFGAIEFVYRTESGSPVNPSASVGITDEFFQEYISVSDLSENPIFQNNIETSDISQLPLDGQRIVLFPTIDNPFSLDEFDGFSYTTPFQSILDPASVLQGDADDGYFNNIPIGFSFRFLGEDFQTLSASTNGWLVLGSFLRDSELVNDLDSVQENIGFPVLAPLWDDLSITSGRFAYTTVGEFGRRIFIAEWLNVFWDFGNDDFVLSFQVRLFEEDGRIEYLYRREVSDPEGASATIGIADGFGGFISLGNSTRNPPVSTTLETDTISELPEDGQLYIFSLDSVTFASNSWTLADYDFRAVKATRALFEEIPGQLVIPEFTEGDSDEGIFDDIPIGFSFSYAGTNYTSVGASTNGWLKLGGDIRTPSPANSLEGNPERPILAPLWDDLDLDPNGGFFSYITEGEAPSRIFTAQWTNVRWPWFNGGSTLSFQVKLYEADNRIEYIYDDPPGSFDPDEEASASIGITGINTGRGSFISIQDVNPNMVATDSTRESRFINNKPPQGMTYTFRLPNLFIVTNTNSTGEGSLSQAIEDANSANGESFIFFRITEPGPWLISGDLPDINQTVTLDATTQPGFNPDPENRNVVTVVESIVFNRVSNNLNPDNSEIFGMETLDDFTLINCEDIRIGADDKPNFIQGELGMFECKDVIVDHNEITELSLQVSLSSQILDNKISRGIRTFAAPNMQIRRNEFKPREDANFSYISLARGSNSVTIGGLAQDANIFDLSELPDSIPILLISVNESRGVSALRNKFICNRSIPELLQVLDNQGSAAEIINRTPTLTSIVSNNVQGKGFPGDSVEVYALEADAECLDRLTISYKGTTVVQEDSTFSLTTSFQPENYVIAAATDRRGNTTPFSDSLFIPLNPPQLTRTAAISEELVVLQWDDNNNGDAEIDIIIYRRLRDSTNLTILDTVNAVNVYRDSTFFDAGATYVYVLKAIKDGVISEFGNELGVAIPGVVLSLEDSWLAQATKIYPNPVENQFSVEFLDLIRGRGSIALEITDVVGKALFSEELANQTLSLDINTSQWPRGIYYVKILIDGQELVRKIVKQ